MLRFPLDPKLSRLVSIDFWRLSSLDPVLELQNPSGIFGFTLCRGNDHNFGPSFLWFCFHKSSCQGSWKIIYLHICIWCYSYFVFEKEESASCHQKFTTTEGDLIMLLNVYRACQNAGFDQVNVKLPTSFTDFSKVFFRSGAQITTSVTEIWVQPTKLGISWKIFARKMT